MAKIRSDSQVINHGIERVVHEKRAQQPNISGHAMEMALSEALVPSQLDELLALPNYDEFIASKLLPYIKDPAIFSPQEFRRRMEKIQAELRAEAERKPKAARPLGRAARLLADGVSMQELLLMYRNALLQG
jgi:hypothetical protein